MICPKHQQQRACPSPWQHPGDLLQVEAMKKRLAHGPRHLQGGAPYKSPSPGIPPADAEGRNLNSVWQESEGPCKHISPLGTFAKSAIDLGVAEFRIL